MLSLPRSFYEGRVAPAWWYSSVMPSEPTSAKDYRFLTPITTRWSDNDAYGHVNNVTFYSWFDTAANLYLISRAGLDVQRSPVIAVVVSSMCDYHAPVSYPERIRAGVRVDKLGNRSVMWGIGIFSEKHDASVAHGTFVHCFVDRATRKPVEIPAAMREALAKIAVTSS